MPKVMNLRIRGSEEASEHLPDVEMWLEEDPDAEGILLKASHSDSDFEWSVMEVFEDFTFRRFGGLKGPFPARKIEERDEK